MIKLPWLRGAKGRIEALEVRVAEVGFLPQVVLFLPDNGRNVKVPSDTESLPGVAAIHTYDATGRCDRCSALHGYDENGQPRDGQPR